MAFRTGEFARDKTGILRPFCPAKAAGSLVEVSLDGLWAAGKRLIMLDVDHTLVKWREEEFSPEVLAWVAQAKEMGFLLCILSNTRHPERLARLSKTIGIKTFNGKFKPSPEMYKMALSEFGVSPDSAVMIGDQMMTDVLGANRAGVDAIWLKKTPGAEFFGTKFNRLIELGISTILYRHLNTAGSAGVNPEFKFLDRPIVRQIVSFLTVGAISFLIDTSIRVVLMRKLHIGSELASEVWGKMLLESYPKQVGMYAEKARDAFAPIAFICGSLIATINSFVFNRARTFKIKEKKDAGKQLIKVMIVSYSGLAINVVVSSLFLRIIKGHETISLVLASVIGAGVAAIWNFTGQRYFAFKVHKRA